MGTRPFVQVSARRSRIPHPRATRKHDPHYGNFAYAHKTAQWHVGTTLRHRETVPLYLAFRNGTKLRASGSAKTPAVRAVSRDCRTRYFDSLFVRHRTVTPSRCLHALSYVNDRSLDIRAIKFDRSSSRTAVNFNPIPRPSSACRTVASARICPSGTRKCKFVITPSSLGFGVSTNTPPTLKSCTRATSSRPSQRQNTQTCCGVSTRVLSLLEGEVRFV
jgi:hypothetical protein